MSDLLNESIQSLQPLAEGALEKMRVTAGEQVAYEFRIGDECIPANSLIGRPVQLEYLGAIHCRHCGRKTSKSFSQGFCYPCFRSLAACDTCIMSPEKCHYHEGTCREPEWGETHCMVPHWVYLANSSGLKVGITRRTQVPIRWMDQGAIAAIPMFEVSTRRIAGLVEQHLRQYVSDRTNWRQMLKGETEALDLAASRQELQAQSQDIVAQMHDRFGADSVRPLDEPSRQFRYPVSRWPEKIRSHNLDKTPVVGGTLEGIKGQYLMFDTGVINLRKFTSYQVRLYADHAPTEGATP